MSFESAIPLNRIAYGADAGFDSSQRSAGMPRTRSASMKQSVNISEDTMMRLARAKLSRAVSQKLAYNQQGSLGSEYSVGGFLSAKA